MKQNKLVKGSIIASFIIIIITFGVFKGTVMASDRPNNKDTRTKIVSSILIEEGDTLWGLATEYYTEEFESINQYIEEIKKSNGILSDTIHTGEYIIIPYYIK